MKYSLTELLLNEYSDKLINRMYDIYKTQTEDNEDQIKQNIKDYDRFKDAVGSKLQQNNPAVLRAVPQDLQQNNRFKDITLIKDYNTLVRILKATAKKETDIYKQAIEYFTKKNPYIDPTVIGSYVARFKQNKNNIDTAVKEKNTTVTDLIPNEILNKGEASNILAYKKFEDLEQLLDGAFSTTSKEKSKTNSAETDADMIYNNPSNGISIYLGDARHKCIKYGKNQYYGWCISRVGSGNMYGGYRFRSGEGKNKMFYFVIDSTATDEKLPNGYFVNPYNAVVINVQENGLYLRTTADNRGDEPYGGTEWDNLGKYFVGEDGQRLWNKIKGLKEYFVFVPPTAEERREEGFKNQQLTLDQFIDLDQEDKTAWLNVNATNRNIVTPEIVASLDNKEINDLINNNRIFSFKELQKSQGLIKRYADYQYTRNPKDPLPYQFIPYLKPELQKKYYNDFNETHITFEILDRFFDKDIVKDYVDKELKAFNYLPEEAKKYMDNEQKQLFDLYSIAFKDIVNYDKPVDETSTKAPSQSTSLPAISKKTFMDLSPKDRKDFIDFYLKLGSDVSNINKNLVFFIGTPTTFEVNNKLFMLVPDTPNSETYNLIDTNGDVLIDGIKGWEVLKDGKPLPNDVNLWRPLGSKSFLIQPEDFDEIEVMRNDKKEKYTKNDFIKQLDEVYLNNYYRNQIKYRAGIIK
jgi:hypothetical protein